MSQHCYIAKNTCPEYDEVLQNISDYVCSDTTFTNEALDTAFICLMDSLGCAFRALKFSECCRYLGPIIAGTTPSIGAKVPGTSHIVDPIKAAWDIGCLIRWLDFNDTWLAAEWGHPSDNLGGILAVSDYLSRLLGAEKKNLITIRHVLEAMIKAHEIQGCIALENSFNHVGLDHVVLVKVASTAVVSYLYGANREQMLSALSHAFVDGQALRTYRHAPNAGPRKSWAAGDATSRAVQLVHFALRGEVGIPSVLTEKNWGFYDVYFNGQPFKFQRKYSDYVMKNVLFKVSYPAEFHAQTAVEAAVTLHPEIKEHMNEIERIEIVTQESAVRIISKEGPLTNYADRDHCLQYMVAVALLFGHLEAMHYTDSFYEEHVSIIDHLRSKMTVRENFEYTQDYHDVKKRSIANALQIFFSDGSYTDRIEVKYPLGHRKRRAEAYPVLKKKFEDSVIVHFSDQQANSVKQLFEDRERAEVMPVDQFIDHICLS